jgi:hypothetical protein
LHREKKTATSLRPKQRTTTHKNVIIIMVFPISSLPLLLFALAAASTTATTAAPASSLSNRSGSMHSGTSSSIRCWGCRLWIPRGGASGDSTYAATLEGVKSQVLQQAAGQIENLKLKVLEQGLVIDKFGEVADEICNRALEDFAVAAPPAPDADGAALYDRALRDVEAAADAPLHVLYLKELGYLREAALQRYRSDPKRDSYEAMLQADAEFVRRAEEATREGGGGDWDYGQERAFLQAVMNLSADAGRRATEAQMNAAQQQQTAMSFLQSQQQMIQQLQMQLYGQSAPWNVGVAYRVPDTNFNVQGSYQQGRANVQLSCVPDEYAPFLGPNGFTNGVGPGNLGLSLNLSL